MKVTAFHRAVCEERREALYRGEAEKHPLARGSRSTTVISGVDRV